MTAPESISDADVAPPAPAEDAVRTLDAFISYSHAADNQLAPALRLGLERLTKPWYRRRVLSVCGLVGREQRPVCP